MLQLFSSETSTNDYDVSPRLIHGLPALRPRIDLRILTIKNRELRINTTHVLYRLLKDIKPVPGIDIHDYVRQYRPFIYKRCEQYDIITAIGYGDMLKSLSGKDEHWLGIEGDRVYNYEGMVSSDFTPVRCIYHDSSDIQINQTLDMDYVVYELNITHLLSAYYLYNKGQDTTVRRFINDVMFDAVIGAIDMTILNRTLVHLAGFEPPNSREWNWKPFDQRASRWKMQDRGVSIPEMLSRIPSYHGEALFDIMKFQTTPVTRKNKGLIIGTIILQLEKFINLIPRGVIVKNKSTLNNFANMIYLNRQNGILASMYGDRYPEIEYSIDVIFNKLKWRK